MSTQTQAGSPEVDEFSCIPETRQCRQAAGVEELVVNLYKVSVHSVHISNKILSGY